VHRGLADSWAVYDNSGDEPQLWRTVDEGENTSESESPQGFCSWSWERFMSCCEGRAEDCANVWDANLCVEKRQSRGREAVNPSIGRTLLPSS
jgi:hypothetical protein